VGANGLQAYFQNPDQYFTRNFPAYIEIRPSAFVDRDLDLRNGQWRGGDEHYPAAFAKGVRVIAIYDVPKVDVWADVPMTVEASNMNVWCGVASATKIY
jgi:hypothetical protein